MLSVCVLPTCPLKTEVGTGEMTWLKAQIALSEDLNSVPGASVGQLTIACNSALILLLASLSVLTWTCTNIHIIKHV